MSDTPQPEDWMTVEEAATALGVNDSRIRQLIGEGRLEARRWGKWSWQVARASVATFQRLKRGPKPKEET